MSQYKGPGRKMISFRASPECQRQLAEIQARLALVGRGPGIGEILEEAVFRMWQETAKKENKEK